MLMGSRDPDTRPAVSSRSKEREMSTPKIDRAHVERLAVQCMGDWYYDTDDGAPISARIRAGVAASDAEDHDGCLDADERAAMIGLADRLELANL